MSDYSAARRLFNFATLVGLMLVAEVGRPQGAAPSDLDRYQGTWVCSKVLKNGQPVPTYLGVKATFKGDRLTWYFPKPDGTFNVRECGFTIDQKQDPKHFDWHYTESPDKNHPRLYRFEGDALWWADDMNDAGRPKSFEAAVWQFEMKRTKE